MMAYDYIIVGAGVAGLYASLNIPTDKKVLIISKNNPWECNTFYAQGGIAAAVDDEDIALHIKDTMQAGAMANDPEAVKLLVEKSPHVIADLIHCGFSFDVNDEGKLMYTKEAAHSTSRIVHAGGDATGRYLHHFLLQHNMHPMLSASVVDLLIDKNVCYGVAVYEQGKLKNIYAKNVIVASGGVGAIYAFHTNARRISGDIQGIAVEKGIPLEYMEMTQFHPTVYVGCDLARKELLTEALRGEGATIVDEAGRRFVFDYDPLGELAPRDIVSRAIFHQTQKTGSTIYLDFSSFKPQKFHKRFPNITRSLKALGFDLPKDRVPISPAFHYALGGIKTDKNGLVEGINNLYAVGEVASSGVHGANRLASNSLLEGLVFSKQAVEHSQQKAQEFEAKTFEIRDTIMVKDGDKQIKQALRDIMWRHVGIVRTHEGLNQAKTFIDDALSKPLGRLVQLRLLTAQAIVQAALNRKTSLGVHYIIEGDKE